MPWYEFTPGAATPQDPSDQNQYTLVGMTPPSCLGTGKICAVQASDTGGKPNLSNNIPLLREVIRAQHNGADSANVLLRT